MSRRRQSGEGSYHKTDRYFVVEIDMPRGTDGKRARKRIYAKTAAELQEKRKAFERAHGQGLRADLEKLTVGVLLDTWLKEGVKIKNRAHTYEAAYEPVVRLHLKPALGHVKVRKLNTARCQALINEKHADGLSPRTLRNIKAILRKALNQAKAWYGLSENVADAVEIPAAARPKYRTLTAEEAQRFLDALAGHRLEALYWTALLMGLREAELIGLPVAALDLDTGTMRVSVQVQRVGGQWETTPTKSGKDTVMSIPSILVPMLRAHFARLDEERLLLGYEDNGLLFPNERGRPLHASYVWKQFKKALDRAGLPSKLIRFHDLRHTCASLLISRGVHLSVIKETLRHSQISITADTYGHVFEETQRAAAETIGSLFVAPEAVPLELPPKKA